MRAISQALADYVAGEAASLAVCVKLTRLDATVMGFTSWDSNLVVSGVTYRADNAVFGSAIRQEIGAGIDNLEVNGVVNSSFVTDADVLAGKYDGALVEMFMVNPLDLSMGTLALQSGIVGEIRTADGVYVAEVRSLTQRLAQNVGRVVTPLCDVVNLGDARCKVNMAGSAASPAAAIRSTGTVTAVVSPTSLRASGIVATAGFYTYGKVTFLTGANAGVSREVKAHGTSLAQVSVDCLWSGASGSKVAWNPGASGLAFNFPVPAGVWSSGFVVVLARWEKRTDGGSDQLYIWVPTANQYTLSNFGQNGRRYENVPDLSAGSMTAVNAAAGGNLASNFSHGAPAATQYMDVFIESAVLTLTGVPAAVSDLLVFGEQFPYAVAVGDTATVEAGCDRQPGTCNVKFANIVNFRGFPYVPGMDQLIKRGRGT